MKRFFGKTVSTNDEAEVLKYELDDTTSTVISPAEGGRMFFYVVIVGNNVEAEIKLQPASSDNDHKGIVISTKMNMIRHFKMPEDFVYTGEISAIAVSGNPTIYVTEY